MALTLDAALAAAQNNQSRRPIIELMSKSMIADIPFDGTTLTDETENEFSPTVIAHSSGRLVAIFGLDVYQIRLAYTDTARTSFTTVDISIGGGSYQVVSVSACEMTDGNIGIILLVNDSSSHLYRLLYRVVTPVGVAVSNGSIATWSHDTFTADPWVITLAENSYALVYVKIDGSDYRFYKRTSNDFATWGSETEMTVGGRTTTDKIYNPSLLKISTGQIWLFFDLVESVGGSGEELKNIYYSTSDDSLATMSNAAAITAYDSFSAIADHPVGVQKVANQIHLLFNEITGALHIDKDTSGVPSPLGTYDELSVDHFMTDSANGKLYAVCIWNQAGTKNLQCVLKIDIPTWSVDQYWTTTTSPAFPAALLDTHCWWYVSQSEYPYIVVASRIIHTDGEGHAQILSVLNVQANTITNYIWRDNSFYSLSQNITWDNSKEASELITFNIYAARISASEDRVYVALAGDRYDWITFQVGYIDLTETSDYQFNLLWERDQESVYVNAYKYTTEWRFYPEQGYLITSGDLLILTTGRITIWNLADGAIVKHYKYEDFPSFPYNGLRNFIFYPDLNRIYGNFAYTAGYGQSDNRGLCEINLSTDVIRYHRPTYASIDDYVFYDYGFDDDGNLFITHHGYGVARFSTSDETWTIFNNDNLPGFDPGMTAAYDYLFGVAYDSVSGLVFVGSSEYGGTGFHGITGFSQYGYLRQAHYSLGVSSGGSYSWGDPDPLVRGYADFDAAGAAEQGSTSSMFVFWTNEILETGEQSIKWDKDGSDFDLTPYLVNDKDVSISRGIEGDPSSLSFSLSHGHLFDPYNSISLLSIYVRKGRKIVVRLGEKVSGVDYWANQGSFFVTSTSFSFERGQYSDISVTAEDERSIWSLKYIFATELYDGTLPTDLLEDVLSDFANKVLADFDFTEFDNAVEIDHQWIDTSIDEIINQICNRFGYFFRLTVDNKASARKISDGNAVDHAYANLDTIIRYSPDDRYSDFTNRVTIVGQERDFQTMIFPEERVGAIAGTVGWWGYKNDFEVPFSKDLQRTCIEPRLVVLETATSIPLQLAGGISESIAEGTRTGYENTYCTVTVSAPSLVGPLVAAVLAYGGFSWAIGNYSPPTGGLTVSVGRWIERALLIIIFMILGSVSNFQYEIYAQPTGKVRRSIQGSDDDEDHQTEIGAVVEKRFDDPLCYSVPECTQVAAQELLVARMQRRRISITKIAHLQDEEGDTIRIPHPISGADIDLFVTNLRRKFRKGTNNDGYFIDEIDGWVVSA